MKDNPPVRNKNLDIFPDTKNIVVFQNEEMERVKNLVLTGKIPIKQAPPEMAQHPVMLIENHCNKLIAERRAKIKIPKVKIPTYLYWDDTPDPPSGLSIERGHVFRKQGERMCIPYNEYLESTEEEDVERGYMLSEEEFDKIKYEDPLVKQLMNCEVRWKLYNLLSSFGIEKNCMPPAIYLL
ncbi:hypothetical protein NQ315_005484, partial [Exocentrus adspersus]